MAVNDEVPRRIGGWFMLESIANPSYAARSDGNLRVADKPGVNHEEAQRVAIANRLKLTDHDATSLVAPRG